MMARMLKEVDYMKDVLGIKKLVDDCTRLKELHRRSSYNERVVKFEIDTSDYCMSFLPTVCYIPYPYRYPNTGVIDIWWLHMHLVIGIQRNKPLTDDWSDIG